MSRRLAVFSGLCIAFAAAVPLAPAQARPDTTRMSCGAARELVLRYGAIVMNTGGDTFDRFVSNGSYCTPLEVTRPAYVPDRSGNSCFVGYTCEQPDPPDDFAD